MTSPWDGQEECEAYKKHIPTIIRWSARIFASSLPGTTKSLLY